MYKTLECLTYETRTYSDLTGCEPNHVWTVQDKSLHSWNDHVYKRIMYVKVMLRLSFELKDLFVL